MPTTTQALEALHEKYSGRRYDDLDLLKTHLQSEAWVTYGLLVDVLFIEDQCTVVRRQLTEAEAIGLLDAMDTGDQEGAHGDADNVLLNVAPQLVADAYQRVVDRSGGFWYA